MPLPTSSPSATPKATATPTVTLTPTPLSICTDRIPEDDLLTIVTLQYGLSREYEPGDLVPLADYLPVSVTLGYPTEIRRVAVEPLVRLINDMQSLGLHPKIISAYRSYSAQAIARQKWVEKAPEYVDALSAPAGYSEHQLGTVVDFGSPELAAIVGLEDVEFHTYFYKTSEGIWLAEHAHEYGFTLSYSREAQEVTGFFYEPWHYRYVGVEMATRLREMGISLTEHQLTTQPLPCIAEESS
jgi:D-alanyl-D-alanine carboxypeptidase